MHLCDVDELFEQRFVPRDIRKVFANAVLEVDIENRAGRLVSRTNAQIRIDRDDTRRQPREDHLEVGALRLDERLAQARLTTRGGESLGHVIERVDQEADLVARWRRQARIEVAFAATARVPGHEILDRCDESPRQDECAIDRGQE